jgi:hypothetical protein
MPRVVNRILKASVFLVRRGYVCIFVVSWNRPVIQVAFDTSMLLSHPYMIVDGATSLGVLWRKQTRITS